MTSGPSDDAWRRMVAKMARSRSRVVGRPPAMPSRWQPHTVLSAHARLPLSDAEAFELIAEHLEGGCAIQEIELRKPPGDRGYVLKFNLGSQVVYAKFQVKSVFIARSFHVDFPGGNDDD